MVSQALATKKHVIRSLAMIGRGKKIMAEGAPKSPGARPAGARDAGNARVTRHSSRVMKRGVAGGTRGSGEPGGPSREAPAPKPGSVGTRRKRMLVSRDGDVPPTMDAWWRGLVWAPLATGRPRFAVEAGPRARPRPGDHRRPQRGQARGPAPTLAHPCAAGETGGRACRQGPRHPGPALL